jgi:hypothetical protein
MFHDQHFTATTPPHQLLGDGASNHGGTWTAPSAGGTLLRDSNAHGATTPGVQTPRDPAARHKPKSTRKKAYSAFRSAFSDGDETERERDRTNPEDRRRRPHYLSTVQDLALRLFFFLYGLCIFVAIFSMLSPDWILPYGDTPVPGGNSSMPLAVGPYTKQVCLLTTDCNQTATGPGGVAASDCRAGIQSDLGRTSILIIIGIVALFLAMWTIIRVGLYNFLFWNFKKDKPSAWRRKKKYRRAPACLSLIAAVLFLVGNILIMGTAQNKYLCAGPLCVAGVCVWGAAFFFMWVVVGICFLGALALFFMWRFPPKDLTAMLEPLELEEHQRRQAALAEEWLAYNEDLGEVAADLDKLVTIEVLSKENEQLQQEVQYLRRYGQPVPSAPSGAPLVQSFKLDHPPSKLADPEEIEDYEGMEAAAASAGGDADEIALPMPSGPGVDRPRPISPGREVVLMRENAVLTKKAKVLEDKWKQEALLRKKLYNELQDLKGKIRVLCRARPFKPEVEEGQVELVFADPYTLQVPAKNKEFVFDCAFPPETRQEQVWAECKALAQSALDGFNVCIFAYGQTGSGKTFTMQGEDDNPGITPRMAQQVFEVCGKLRDTHTVVITCYMVELYLEDLNDLLYVGNKRDAPKLDIKLDVNGVVTIRNITTREATSADELMKIYQKGTKQRHVRSHAMNDASSRSHLVFCITMESTNTVTGKVTAGKLSLVDLAGSERLKKTRIDATGVEEATSINDSLFELGKVISDLSSDNPSAYVNKRNSKLTMIMSDSIGGNAKTLMIVCVSPATFNLAETVNSLEFAMRCKKVTNSATKNEETKQLTKLKQQYKQQIDELQAEVDRLRAQANQR